MADVPEDPARPAAGARRRPPTGRTVYSLSEDETVEFGRALSRRCSGGELLLLEGPLGAGKTVFVRGLAVGLDLPAEDVWSPSYTLVHEYRGGRLPLFHVDLYRLEDPADIATLGLEELLACGGLVAVEWGERVPSGLRGDAVVVRFHVLGEGSRRIELQPPDPGRTGPAPT